MATHDETNQEVQHDEDNGKFFIPFSDKQAVLRYTQEDGTIDLHSIFIPPSLRDNGLADRIVESAYDYAGEQDLDPSPQTPDEFFKENQDFV